MERDMGLAERFWSLARGMDASSFDRSPVGAVNNVLAVLDALDRGESGTDVSVNTLSFLALLRESEQRGDLCYASPEQIRGESLDERSLVFSVGVLLFERLTGRHPYGRDQEQRAARIQRGEMGSGVNYFPNVPAGLRALLMRAMGPFPEERFKSLTELRARLEQFVQDQLSTGPGTGPRLPGTYGNSGAKNRPEATRVVRMSTSFGRDLMAANEAAPENRETQRLERMSELHRRTTPVREATGIKPPAAAQARDESRPARSPLPRAPSAPPRVKPTNTPGLIKIELEESGPVTQTLDTAALTSVMVSEGSRAPRGPDAQPKQRRGSGLASRLVWAAAGAATAAAIMWLTMRATTGSKTGEAKAPTPAAVPTSARPADKTAGPGPDRTTAAAVGLDASTAPVAAVFSAEDMGRQALQSMGPCFPESRRARGVRFRVGLRFTGENGTVDRVYFSTDEEIDTTERGCVRDHLIGLTPDAAPDHAGVVDYQIRMSRNSTEVVVK